MRQRMRRGVLLERDGVLLHHPQINCSASWNDFDFLPLALDALRLFAENGVTVMVFQIRLAARMAASQHMNWIN